MHILGVTPLSSYKTPTEQLNMLTVSQALDTKTILFNQKKQMSGLALYLIFHRFSPFNCCLNVVL